MSVTRLLVSSGTADAINTNRRLRQRIHQGFLELGLHSAEAPLEQVAALLEAQRPELLLITGSIADPAVDLAWLVQRARALGCQVAFWLHDDPYEFDLHWPLAELDCRLFSNEPHCLPYYPPELHARSLALAASPLDAPIGPGVHDNDAAVEVDLGFCGAAFPQRVAVLRQLTAAGLTLACWGEGWPDDLPGAVNRRLGPAGLRQLYRRCRWVLNLGRELPIANRRWQIASSTPGPRTFEAALLGAAQLYVGQSPRINHYYGPEQGVIAVRQVEEVQELVQRARREPSWRRRLGRAAASHTRRHHLYRHRCHDLLAALQETSA